LCVTFSDLPSPAELSGVNACWTCAEISASGPKQILRIRPSSS
jgi:hypothetical protein